MLALKRSHRRQSENDDVAPIKSEHHDESDILKADRLDLHGPGVLIQKMRRNRGMVLVLQSLRICVMKCVGR